MSRPKKAEKAAGTTVAVTPEKVVNPKDLQLLRVNEEIIAKGQSGFLDIGKALKAIRDQKQFMAAGYDDFESYCVKKWGYSQNYANRLVAAHNCHEVLKKELALTGERLPSNEYQYRSLAGLTEDKWVGTWKQILTNAADKPVTGEMVEAAVKAVSNPSVAKPEDKDAKAAADAKKT